MSDHWIFGWDQILAAVNSAAVIFAAGAGIWGVRTWRLERHDTRQAEIAEDLLALMYEGQSVIAHIRNPFSYAGEGSSRPRPSVKESDKLAIERDGRYVPIERIERHASFFDRVIELKPLVRAYFGRGAVAHLDALLAARAKVLVAARAEIREAEHERQFRSDAEIQAWATKQEKRDAVLWEGSNDDELASNIRHHMERAENLTLSIIRVTGNNKRSWLSGTLLERTPRGPR